MFCLKKKIKIIKIYEQNADVILIEFIGTLEQKLLY